MTTRKWALAAGLLVSAGSAFGQAYTENFDNVATVLAGSTGWAWQNLSNPVGTTNWFQGNLAVFPQQASAGYIGANFNNSGGSGDISNWLFTPTRTLQNGDTFKFWARSIDSTFPDRLAVRMSLNGSSTNVGATTTSVGDFTTELLVINPNLIPGPNGPFPNVWTEHTIVLSGIPAPTSGRIAFWYNAPIGGPLGINTDYIGIDEVSYTPGATICYPDCNQSTTLTIADFACFQAAFANSLPYADCNNSGTYTIADFACFQAAFANGCP